jgi:hypothetical protein
MISGAEFEQKLEAGQSVEVRAPLTAFFDISMSGTYSVEAEFVTMATSGDHKTENAGWEFKRSGSLAFKIP